MKAKKWIVAPRDVDAVRRLSHETNVSKITAQVLLQRGVKTATQLRQFMNPDLDQLHDPFKFEDMRAAVRRIRDAVKNGEKIGIFGDYDVDGITGSTVLKLFFRLLGVEVETYIPHRTKEGYGLNIAAVDELASSGVKVLITVDCGTTAFREIEHAVAKGMDVIILDHHEQGAALPPAIAVVNPKRQGTTYPFQGICSGGLAFKLAWALSEDMPQVLKQSPRYREFLLNAFSFVTLATVADVSPLIDENRVLVRFGMEAMRSVPNKGLRLLMEKSRIKGAVTEFDIGFRIAPRLNAIGRMGHARDAVALFTIDNETEIVKILEMTEKANRDRQKTEAGILDEALYQVEKHYDAARDPLIVVASQGWHAGVVGIIAARLVDRYHCPSIVLSIEGERARGSARSVDGFNLAEALDECKQSIEGMRCGGHAMAAGVEVPLKDLERFKELIAKVAARMLANAEREAKMHIDDEVSLAHVTTGVCKELEKLSPHGMGNPEPLLAVRNVKVQGEPRIMKEKHLAFFVGDGQRAIRTVAFGMGFLANELPKYSVYDVAFTPQINTYAGEDVELILKDIRYVR